MNRILKSLLFLVVAGLSLVTFLHAATLDWTYGGVDRWINTPGNWGGVAPTSADTLKVNVTINSPLIDATHMTDANELLIGDAGSGQVEMFGGTVNVTTTLRVATSAGDSSLIMTDGIMHKIAGGNSVRFGAVSGGTGRLTMSGTSKFNVDNNNFLFGYTTGSVGYLTMSDTAAITVGGGQSSIGYSGAAHATMSGGSNWDQTGGNWVLGYQPGTIADMTLTDQAWVRGAGLTMVGWQGANATLNINTTDSTTPAHIEGKAGFQIGNSDAVAATTGTVNLNGYGQIRVSGGEMLAGTWRDAQANLNMYDDSQLITDSGIRFGNRGGDALVNMSGNATINTTSWITLGDSENAVGHGTAVGVMNMSGNATINQNNGNLHLGLWNDSDGTLNMTDNAKIIKNGWTVLVGDSWSNNGNPGTYGVGALNMTGNALIDNTMGDIAIGNNAKGRGTVTLGTVGVSGNEMGPKIRAAGWFFLGAGGGGEGTLTVWNGTVDHTVGGSTYTGPMFIGRSGSKGVWNQNGGLTMDDQGTYMAETWRSGGVTYYGDSSLNLNAGVYSTLWIRHWDNGIVGGGQVVRFDGGTLKATADSGNYINNDLGVGKGNMKVLVGAGGAKINTSDLGGLSHYVQIAVPLEHDAGPANDGGLEKTGGGTLVLSAANTFNGPTKVSDGILRLTRAASLATKDVTVKSNTTLELGAASNLGALTSLDLQSGSNLSVALPALPTAAFISTAAMPNTIGINYTVNAVEGSLTPGAYTVISGFTGGTVQTIPVPTNMRAYSATADVSATDVKFNIVSTGQTAANLLWNAAYNNWDIGTTPNWDGADGLFYNLDNVKFDDAYPLMGPGKVVNVFGTVHPGSITINVIDPTDPFLFQGSGAITGVGTSLTKTGTGEAIINNLGGIDITGTITLAGGTFGTGAATGPNTLAGDIAFSGGGAISAAGGPLTLTGVINDTGSSGLIKSGGGRVILTNTANAYAGPTKINSGYLVVSSLTDAGAGGTPSMLGTASNVSSNLVFNGGYLHYTGPSTTVDRGYMTIGGDSGIRTDNDLTLTGDVDSTAGAFHKTGPGKVTWNNTTAHANVLSNLFLIVEGPAAMTAGNYTVTDWMDVGTRGHAASLAISNAVSLNITTTWATGAFNNGVGDVTMSDTASVTTGGWMYIGWASGKGKLTMNGSSVLKTGTVSGGDLTVGYRENGAVGELIMNDDAKIITSGPFWVGNYAANDNNSPTGTVTLNNNAEIVVNHESFLGRWGGTGYLNLNDNSKVAVHGWFGIGDNWGDDANGVTGYGVVNVNGATASLLCDGAKSDWAAVPVFGISIGVEGGNGIWNQNAGTTTATSAVLIGDTDQWGSSKRGNGTLNLNGGTFQAPLISTGNTITGQETQTIATVNFNGGVLKASAASADYIANPHGATLTLNVLAGGMKFDTNGFDITITKALNHSGTATDGGLEKIGIGTLTLTGPVSYNGATLIDAGRLSIDNGLTTTLTTVSGPGWFAVGATNPATVVNATSIAVGTLSIGSGFFAVSSASVATVPEPSTIVLLVLAGLTLVATYVRRR